MTDEHDKRDKLSALPELRDLATPSRRNFLKSVGVSS